MRGNAMLKLALAAVLGAAPLAAGAYLETAAAQANQQQTFYTDAQLQERELARGNPLRDDSFADREGWLPTAIFQWSSRAPPLSVSRPSRPLASANAPAVSVRHTMKKNRSVPTAVM